jgi:hypothetical protein
MRRREGGSHPATPIIVFEHRRNREHTVLDEHEPACRQAMLDGALAEPKLHQLAAGDPVELRASKSRHTSVPHTLL